MSSSLFQSPLTFLNLPFSTSFEDADVAILGIPYDCARDMIRYGSRLGPNAVRHASILTGKLLKDADPQPLESLNVVDAGNVRVSLEDIEFTFRQIEAAVSAILDASTVPVCVGGDGAVSLPQMRSLRKTHGPVALLHIDAHTDAWPVDAGNPYTNANQFTHAANEGLLQMDHAIHLGVRGPVNATKAIRHAESLGYEVIPFDAYVSLGMSDCLSHLHDRLRDRPVFLCFDMDFFDPGIAPGVATPTPGGALAYDGINLLKNLGELNIVAVDINTTSPAHDQGGGTAALAASLVAESLGVLSGNF